MQPSNSTRAKTCSTALCVLAILCCWSSSALGDILYQTNFDSLALGHTQPFPGAPGQDGWYSQLAVGAAFGEIQGAIANPGRALHEFGPASNPASLQTIDTRGIPSTNVSTSPLITLSFDFLAHSSDLSAVNGFNASMTANGGPSPGFQVIFVDIGAGNGTPKNVTGVNVSLAAFNGSDNNVPIPLTVGQQLSWNTWHSVTVALDQVDDTYRFITVDGQTQTLAGFLPPRSFPGSVGVRGQLIESLSALVIPDDVGGIRTNDDIYWDNVRLTAVLPGPEPTSIALVLIAAACSPVFIRRRR
jgi:hypothetical protein